jgi:hypothetical protein
MSVLPTSTGLSSSHYQRVIRNREKCYSMSKANGRVRIEHAHAGSAALSSPQYAKLARCKSGKTEQV